MDQTMQQNDAEMDLQILSVMNWITEALQGDGWQEMVQ